jgi:hypothetical protein
MHCPATWMPQRLETSLVQVENDATQTDWLGDLGRDWALIRRLVASGFRSGRGHGGWVLAGQRSRGRGFGWRLGRLDTPLLRDLA